MGLKIHFEQFDNCDALNEYLAVNPNEKVKDWQMVKLCTGNTVIMVEFETSSKTVING